MAKYLFIDGAYLDEVVERLSSELWGIEKNRALNYSRLASGYEKTFYYNCPPPKKHDESEQEWEQRAKPYYARLAELSELTGWRVFEGSIKRHKKRGATQKEVDVQIAVDLLTHSFRRNMESATLLAGDQDFRPVVEAASREGMFVSLWCERRSASEELRRAADSRYYFDWWTLGDLRPADLPGTYDPPQRHGSSGLPLSVVDSPNLVGRAADGCVFHVLIENGRHQAWRMSKDEKGFFECYQHQLLEGITPFINVHHGAVQWSSR